MLETKINFIESRWNSFKTVNIKLFTNCVAKRYFSLLLYESNQIKSRY